MHAHTTKTSPQKLISDQMSKHKRNYQNYLNNIYQTIKEKQFYIHQRSQTSTIDLFNNHHLVGDDRLVGIQQVKNTTDLEINTPYTPSNNKVVHIQKAQSHPKSFPKLTLNHNHHKLPLQNHSKSPLQNAKSPVQNTDINLQIIANSPQKKKPFSYERKTNSSHNKYPVNKMQDKSVSPQRRKPLSSNSKKTHSQKIKNHPQTTVYLFSNLTQSIVSPNIRQNKQQQKLRQNKQYQENPSESQEKQTQQNLISPDEKIHRKKQDRISLFRKISQENMNLLGLKVQKINYSRKKQPFEGKNTHIRFLSTRTAKPFLNKIQNTELLQDNGCCLMIEKNAISSIQKNATKQQNINNQNSQPELNQQNLMNIELCQQLISKKMQINQSNLLQFKSSKKHVLQAQGKTKPSQNDKKILNNQQALQLNPIYENRYKKYLNLILKLSFSYKKYGQMDQLIYPESHQQIRTQKKYKAWIGTGNNGHLLKALIKRRFWWQIVEEKSWNVNFLWTQLKNNEYFRAQKDHLSLKQNKKQQNVNKLNNSLNKDQSKSTKMEESTTESTELKMEQRKPHKQLQKNKRHSSLPGTLIQNIKNRTSSSPLKKKTNKIPTDQILSLEKLLNKIEVQQYKKKYYSLDGLQFGEKLQLLEIKKFSPIECRVHNHLENNFYLGNKKALFHSLKQYYSLTGGNLFKTVPLTFHIKKGTKDPQYKRFLAYYKKRQNYIKKQQKQMELGNQQKRKMRNIWIVKPGENTNRGNGITVIDEVYELNSIMKSEGKHNDGTQKTFIVQLYIDRPLLYKRRKFDIRHFMLISQIHGVMKAYWFEEGYIRTSGYEFDVENFQRQIHLTNDAVQKYTPNYGKFQPANKISYNQFQKYLDQTYPKKNLSFFEQILPRMKEICLDAVKSAALRLSPDRVQHNFELFGMDFMIDSDFEPWLIEINTNPCLQLTNPLQSRLLPQILDETLRLTLDVIYPPPCHYPNTYRHLVPQTSNMKAQLIYDSVIDGKELEQLYRKRNEKVLLQQIGEVEDDEVFEECQQQLKLQELQL